MWLLGLGIDPILLLCVFKTKINRFWFWWLTIKFIYIIVWLFAVVIDGGGGGVDGGGVGITTDDSVVVHRSLYMYTVVDVDALLL